MREYGAVPAERLAAGVAPEVDPLGVHRAGVLRLGAAPGGKGGTHIIRGFRIS